MSERSRSEALYDLHRDKAWEDIKSGTESFDKYMLTFSSGALGLSIAFIKDVVPLRTAVWIGSLISSWIAFVLCILATLASFRLSVWALETTVPALNEYYLQGKQDAFDRHLKTFPVEALRWCTFGQGLFFAMGVILTMTFVIANVREGRMSKNDATQKVVTGDLEKGLRPSGMTPLSEGAKPSAMTPVVGGNEDRGAKPPAITPVQPAAQNPAPAPSQPQSPKK